MNYYFDLLSERQQDVYKEIINCFSRCKYEIEIPTLPHIEIEKIVEAVNMDNPWLFYVDFSRYKIRICDCLHQIVFNPLYSIKQIKELNAKINDSISKFETIRQLSDLEKEITIHNSLLKKIIYDSTNSSEIQLHSVIGPLLSKRTVCEGYAKAFKLLCDSFDITCIVVCGELDTEGKKELHAWNMVKLNGSWMHVDVTCDNIIPFSSPVISSYYFNIGDQRISANHYWDRESYPKCVEQEMPFRKVIKSINEIEFYLKKCCSQKSGTLRFAWDEQIGIDESNYVEIASKYAKRCLNNKTVEVAFDPLIKSLMLSFSA